MSALRVLLRLLFWFGRALAAVVVGGLVATIGGMFGIAVNRNLENPDPDISGMLGIAVLGGTLGSVVGIAAAALLGLPVLMTIGLFGLKFPWIRSRLIYMTAGVGVAWYAGAELLKSLQSPGIEGYKMAIFALCAGMPSALVMRAIMERRSRSDVAASAPPPTAVA